MSKRNGTSDPVVQTAPFDARLQVRTLQRFNSVGAAFYYPNCALSWMFHHRKVMTDFVFIGVMVLFFVVGGLYVLACDKM